MTLTTVLLLIVIGLLIVLAEIFFVPGSTIVGVIGIVLILVGIVGAFYLGRNTGFLVFGITLALVAILGYFGFKTNTWQRFAVKSAIDGKATEDARRFQIGQSAITLTRCAPIGKARFEDGTIEEVYSSSDMIPENTPIHIHRIIDQKIIVKPQS